MINKLVYRIWILLSILFLTSCSTTSVWPNFSAAETTVRPTTALTDNALWQEDPTRIWLNLQHTPLTTLNQTLTTTTDPTIAGWLKLAIISKQDSLQTTTLTQHLIAWRQDYPAHPGNTLFPDNSALNQLASLPYPKHIALLLPLTGPLQNQGQAVRDGFLNAYYAALATTSQSQTTSFYDTNLNPNIAALYQQALNEGADFVIGPLDKDKVAGLLSHGGFSVPTLALNYTTVSFSSLPQHFYEFGLSPNDEAVQVATRAAQNNLHRAIVIAPQDAWGQGIANTLTQTWRQLGGTIVGTYYFTNASNLTDDIPHLLQVDIKTDRAAMQEHKQKNELTQERRQDFDVIFLIAQPTMARQIVPLLKYYYADNIPIYATSSVYSGTPAPQKDADLNGVIFCDIPWVLLSSNTPEHGDRFYAVGLDAYVLSHELPRLTALPNFPIYGATGALTLTPQQQIYRRLPWATMHDGHP